MDGGQPSRPPYRNCRARDGDDYAVDTGQIVLCKLGPRLSFTSPPFFKPIVRALMGPILARYDPTPSAVQCSASRALLPDIDKPFQGMRATCGASETRTPMHAHTHTHDRLIAC